MGMDEQAVLAAMRGRTPNEYGWVSGNCPLCEARTGKPDRKRSLGLSLRTANYHCFKCGVKGHIFDLEDLYMPDGTFADDTTPVRIYPPEDFYPFAEERDTLCFQLAWDYLRSRHLSDEQIEELGIGACARGKCAGRVVVPLLDTDRNWAWWVARAWVPKAERPYMYPKGPRGGLMFNECALDVETDEPVLVVEGCFDAFPHLPDVVACLGKPNPKHMERLGKAKRPVIFSLDGDAWEEALAACWQLTLDGVLTGAIRLPPKTDPHVTCREALRDAARRAVGQSFSVDLRE